MIAEFQTRSKGANEGWAAFAEDLKVLADKAAFPQLQNDAKEQLALNHYLGQLTDQQIAFNVRQKRPRTLDEAVSSTLELESYLVPLGLPPAGLHPSQVVAGVRQPQNEIMQMLAKMMEHLDHLESERATPPPRRSTGARQQRQTGVYGGREGSRAQRYRIWRPPCAVHSRPWRPPQAIA